jgi:hypothetical protein
VSKSIVLQMLPHQAVDIPYAGGHLFHMAAVITAPKSWVASVGRLSLPKKSASRLQLLMDRNNDGLLTPAERRELTALVEWSENVSIIRAQALQLLGRQPA